MKEIRPLTILEDRYGGAYSKAGFLAFNLFYKDIPAEVEASDLECQKFWKTTKLVIGKGMTEEEAKNDLRTKLSKKRK